MTIKEYPELEYYGGNGIDGEPENAHYCVKWADENKRHFGKLSKAVEFYNTIIDGKALWNHDTVELLEAHSLK